MLQWILFFLQWPLQVEPWSLFACNEHGLNEIDFCKLNLYRGNQEPGHFFLDMNLEQLNLIRCNLNSDHFNSALDHIFRTMAVALQTMVIAFHARFMSGLQRSLSQLQRGCNSPNR